MARLDKLLEKADKAKSEKTDLSFAKNSPSKKPIVEKRTARLNSYITDKEKNEFLGLIGRMSESDAVRHLVLEFNKQGKKIN